MLHEQVGHDEVGVDDTRHAHPAAGDLLDHQGVGQQGLTQAAELLGDGQAEDAQLLETVDDLLRVGVGVLELLGDRDDLLVHEDPHGLQDLGLVLGEAFGLAKPGHRVPFRWWCRTALYRRVADETDDRETCHRSPGNASERA